MSQKHLGQIWQWVSLTCLLFLLSSVISIQGGAEFLGNLVGGKDAGPDNDPAVGYFGAIIGGALFFVASSALLLHTRRHGVRWHDRVPVLWLDGLDTARWEGKVFQALTVIALVLLPMAGIAKCISEAEKGDICEFAGVYVHKGEDTSLLAPPERVHGTQMRLRRGNSGGEPCKAGVEIFPFLGTPLLVYGLPVLGLMTALTAIFSLFRRP